MLQPLVNHKSFYICHLVRGKATLQDQVLKVLFLICQTVLTKKNNNENHQLVQKETEKNEPLRTTCHGSCQIDYST